MNNIERQIAEKLIDAGLAAGYELRIWEGEDCACSRTADKAVLMGVIASTDYDYINFYRPGERTRVGYVFLYGNDTDLISDWNDALDGIVNPINDWVNDTLRG